MHPFCHLTFTVYRPYSPTLSRPLHRFAHRFREARKSLGFSRKETARRLGVFTSTVKRWEAGGTLPGKIRMERISRLFGTQFSALEEA